MKRLVAVCAVALLIAAEGKDTSAKELKKLEGNWQLVSETADGTARNEDYVKTVKVTIEADGKWKVVIDGKPFLNGTSKIDATKSPKAIDYIVTAEGENKGRVVRAIYEVKDDEFKQCFAVENDRPTAFASKAGSGHTLSTYKRIK